jgi:hypothetical protein
LPDLSLPAHGRYSRRHPHLKIGLKIIIFFFFCSFNCYFSFDFDLLSFFFWLDWGISGAVDLHFDTLDISEIQLLQLLPPRSFSSLIRRRLWFLIGVVWKLKYNSFDGRWG